LLIAPSPTDGLQRVEHFTDIENGHWLYSLSFVAGKRPTLARSKRTGFPVMRAGGPMLLADVSEQAE
jgi:hypothetical protein